MRNRALNSRVASSTAKQPTLAYRAVEALARRLNIQEPYRHGIEAAIAHLAEENAEGAQPQKDMYRRFAIEERSIGGSPVFIFRSKATPPARRVLFLHGGGGMMRATYFHYVFLTRLILQTHAEVWMPFYPLAPGCNFHDSLRACMAAYRAMLLEHDAMPCAFAGDSAGANLELAVCRQALDEGLDTPRCIVCISPATGFHEPGYYERFKAKEQAARDPLLCAEMVQGIRDNWYADMPLDDVLGNPAFIDYAGFPPVLEYLGTAEIFHPSTEDIVARMEEAGIEATCVRGEGLMHDWALLNYFPEGAAAHCQIKRFILGH